MMRYLVASDSPRLAVAADRLAEACLLQALRDRARADAAAEAHEHARALNVALLQRETLHTDLVASFGVSTLSLLHARIVDGRDPRLDDARALLTYRYPYELRANRTDRLWSLSVLSDDGQVVNIARATRPLIVTFPMSLRGEEGQTELWCAVADLATRADNRREI